MIWRSGNTERRRRFLLGYELGDRVCRISYVQQGTGLQPETLSLKAGAEDYDIPTMLLRDPVENRWFYGREALMKEDREGMVPVRDLLSAAIDGADIEVAGESFDPVALLTLFVKRTFSLLALECSPEEIAGILFTVHTLDARTEEVLGRMSDGLGLTSAQYLFRSYEESFYHYVMNQEPALMNRDVIAFDYDADRIECYYMACNRRTTPVVVTLSRDRVDRDNLPKQPEGEALSEQHRNWLDEEFLRIVQTATTGKLISSVYLVGEGFRPGWMNRSLEFLCRTRRVFQGNNLFCKGACYAAGTILEQEEKTAQGLDTSTEFILLGRDQLRVNLGLDVVKQGTKSYLALMDAGANWYDAGREVDLILDHGEALELKLLPLTSGTPREIRLALPPFSEDRPERCTRLRLRLDMDGPERIRVRLTDLGFGEFFPGTGQTTEEFVSYETEQNGEDGPVPCRVLLCMGRVAELPYHISRLGRDVATVEELCYVLAHSAFLLEEDFAGEALAEWLAEQCGLTELGQRLMQTLSRRQPVVEAVRMILEYVRYNTEEEIEDTLRTLSETAGLNVYEKRLARIRHFVGERYYAAALAEIDGLLDRLEEQTNPMDRALLLYNKGVICARLFLYERAQTLFLEAYELARQASQRAEQLATEAYIAFLAAKRMCVSEQEYIDYVASHPQAHRFSLELESRRGEAEALYDADDDNLGLRSLALYRSEGRRKEYQERLKKLTDQVYNEYRLMVDGTWVS
ncbi:MAG: hypothetical protein IJT34_08285 [Butyrivibrio sp.]|nr:hypothetical protein [Butyrivibrio sp.]